jgi:hypothetical protein
MPESFDYPYINITAVEVSGNKLTKEKIIIRELDINFLDSVAVSKEGDQMYYFRSNVKYELIKPKVKKVKPGDEKNKFKSLQYAFYLNFFADAGYFTNRFTEINPLNNKMLFSWGLGIDFVAYYDMVLRLEYAFTSVGTNGFFFGFGMPI